MAVDPCHKYSNKAERHLWLLQIDKTLHGLYKNMLAPQGLIVWRWLCRLICLTFRRRWASVTFNNLSNLSEISWPASARILVHDTIYRRLLIGRDGHLDQSEAYDISWLVRQHCASVIITCPLVLSPPVRCWCCRNSNLSAWLDLKQKTLNI